jgi:hypothetical protein
MGPEFVTSIVPSELITVKVAQKAKDVLVEPVLLLINNVKGLIMMSPEVQVSQGVEGIVAFTKLKSFEVHELAGGKVCAVVIVIPQKLTNKNRYRFP